MALLLSPSPWLGRRPLGMCLASSSVELLNKLKR